MQQLNELSINTEDNASVLLCYILAQLNIKHSNSSSKPDGSNSNAFSHAAADYGLSIPLPEYIHDVRFTTFASTLVHHNLHTDYDSFLEYFTPRLVSQWDKFKTTTSNLSALDISVLLYLTLTETNALQLRFNEINQKIIVEMYQRLHAVFPNLSAESFLQLWESIFYIPMPKLKVGFSRKLIEAVKFYRKYKVSGFTLLENYCQYNRHKTHLEGAFNPWSDFQRVIKNTPSISGVSITESAFNLIRGISRELPTDIIRAAIYPHPEFFTKSSGVVAKPNNDGRFECSFLLQEFEKFAKYASNILIVNPGPDFLLRWNDLSKGFNCNCTIAVPNICFASAYRMQFSNFKFCLYSDLDSTTAKFDLVAIISTTGEELDIGNIVSQCCDSGRIIALLPQTILTKENVIDVILSSCYAEKIISISPDATVTIPAKKMILYARKTSSPIKSLPIFFTQCDSKADNLIIEKSFIRIQHSQLFERHTLNQLRSSTEKKKQEAGLKSSRNKALIYSFSDEIKLRYTIHIDKHGTFVGEVYYKALLRQDKKKKCVWDSSVTQKGLRSKDRTVVVANLEATAYYGQLTPYITGDILQFYGDNIGACSLKTIWFCCRNSLLQQASYDDHTVQNVLFPSTNSALSSIYPESATDEDYLRAMASVIPVDSKATVKYWHQLNLIMRTAVTLRYLRWNPITSLLPEISKKASKEMINLRNALTKKTFTPDEESRIFSYICQETSTDFGPRKAKRYEVESIWLLGAIRLFTGISIREACALTWADFVKVDALGAFHLLIYKYLRDDGTCSFKLDESSTKYSYRKVPVAPILSNMFNSRLAYMRAVLGYTDSEIKSTPIILSSERNISSKYKDCTYCKYSTVSKLCRQIIEAANIPTQELILPGNDETVVDMNKYMGDIFYTNFRHRANHLCAFSRGELSYVLGNKGPDTFSQHYCDYSSDLIQYGMVQKLRRWTCKYECLPPATSAVATSKSHIGNFTVSSGSNTSHPYSCLDLTLSANEINAGSYIDLSIECEHGIAGTISVFSKGE